MNIPLLKRIGVCLFIVLFGSSFVLAQDRPNVLFLICDDLNDYEGVYGGHPQAKTPNIDNLADSSVVFANAHSNAPICAPMRAALFTGIYPHVSGNFHFDRWDKHPVLENSKTIMEYMRENGYQALGAGKLLHFHMRNVWTEYGLRHKSGPIAWNGKKGVGHPSVPEHYSSQGLLDGTFASLADIPTIPATDDAPGYDGWWDNQANKPFRYVNEDDRDLMGDELLAEWAMETIQKLDKERNPKPFFMAIGFSKPHTPLVAPQSFFDLFPLETLQIPVIKEGDAVDCHYLDNFPASHKGPRFYQAMKDSYPSVEEGLRRYLQAYLACVAYVDAQIGKVLDALDASGLSGNTLVILTSDHGYNHGQKDYLFKNSLWEESSRVPLLIRLPENLKHAGKRVSRPVSLIDIYPTLVDLCDLKGETRKNDKGAELGGFSLKPLVQDPVAETWDGPDVALISVKSPGPSNVVADQNFALRSQFWRYILYQNGDEELYDHRLDPHEWTNLADELEFKTKKAAMRKQLVSLVPALSGK